MIKTLMVIRLGIPQPTVMEQKIFAKIVNNPEDQASAQFIPIHGGIVSMIKTHLSADKLTDLFKDVSEKFHTAFPVIVIELESGKSAFHLNACPNFEDLLSQYQVQQDSVVDNLSLDELLDLVSTKGMQNLSTAELERLKKLSEK